ncbi:MAG: hypothetical protein AAGF11_13310 [Myxococcota bacterium]
MIGSPPLAARPLAIPRSSRGSSRRSSRGPTRRPVDTEYVDAAHLDHAQRLALARQLFVIYRELFDYGDEAFFREHVLFPPHQHMRLALFRNEHQQLVGYTNVWVVEQTIDGRAIGVMRSAIFSRLGYRVVEPCIRLNIEVALRQRLAAPRTPLWLFTITATPASYRLLRYYGVEFYPRRDVQDPITESLGRQLVEALGLQPVGERPWVIHFPARPVHPERLRGSQSLDRDPDARFFRRLVTPHGPDHVVVVLAPVTLRNTAIAVMNTLRRGLGRWIGHRSK